MRGGRSSESVDEGEVIITRNIRGANMCVLCCLAIRVWLSVAQWLSGSVADNALGKGMRAWRIITGVTTEYLP